MVWTVRRNRLRFLTDLSMRCKLQPELRCTGYTQTRVHMLTHDKCSLLSIRGRKPRQSTPQLCHALTYLSVFICWVPQITLTLHFLRSERLKTFAPSAMCCCPSVFLFHRRALSFQPIRPKVRRTRRTVPRAYRTKRFGLQTQICRSSSNCQNQVREVKVRTINNGLCSPNLFHVRRTPRTRCVKQKFVQLRTGLRVASDCKE